MKDKQKFIDALDLQQDLWKNWFVAGNVEGDVSGRVNGNVDGHVHGWVGGDVKASVHGDVWGSVNGDVRRNVAGNVCGTVRGDVFGDVKGTVKGKIHVNLPRFPIAVEQLFDLSQELEEKNKRLEDELEKTKIERHVERVERLELEDEVNDLTKESRDVEVAIMEERKRAYKENKAFQADQAMEISNLESELAILRRHDVELRDSHEELARIQQQLDLQKETHKKELALYKNLEASTREKYKVRLDMTQKVLNNTKEELDSTRKELETTKEELDTLAHYAINSSKDELETTKKSQMSGRKRQSMEYKVDQLWEWMESQKQKESVSDLAAWFLKK